ncbi:MAG TPA: EAL domain-containing protein [Ramlibacter sp.]|jgi:diguanylate cyclase (GGDEF)-like protein|nr:EAL domain-containing protein [Ramlibacter sp.]
MQDTTADSELPSTLFLEAGSAEEEARVDVALHTLSGRSLWRQRSAVGLSEPVIMMVDDEDLNIEMTQALLADFGYTRFSSTTRPEDALALMRRQVPAVLLLDLSMPRMGGLEVLAAMRADALVRHVPVIVLTGSTDPQTKLAALGLGAIDFLSKPVDGGELALRIRNTLAVHAYREFLTQHDSLTALPNKRRCRAFATEALEEATRAGHRVAVIHVGMDRLGRINDALGRTVGDQLLQRMAKRLASCVQTEVDGALSSPERDPTLFRIDGDEFAIVVPALDDIDAMAAFLSKLLEDAVVKYQPRGGAELTVTCSAGVAVFPNDGDTAETLSHHAGLAMHHAKRAGAHRCEFFSASLKDEAMRELPWAADLGKALKRREIDLLYAPRVQLANGRALSLQATLRWRHASGQVLQGDELMKAAGSGEMHLRLLEWLLDQLRKDTAAWQEAGLQPPRIAVKVSLAHVQPLQLSQLVDEASASGLDISKLAIDLQHVASVEGMGARDWAHLAAMRSRGVRCCLDGFGVTGTVSHLRRLAYDEVKLDASFLADLESDTSIGTMVLGMADLARRMRLACVATDVDTPAQLAFLKKHDWPLAQGRAVGEAVDATSAGPWLQRSR